MPFEQAIYARRADTLTGLVHHSDRGTQYLSMRYTDRLADAGIAPSVGSQGDAFDNALAESVIGLFKTEVIRRKGPWRSLAKSRRVLSLILIQGPAGRTRVRRTTCRR
jgi:transposase InsO family protein